MTIHRFIKNKDMKNNKEFNFTEGWLSGFTQSDGCFTVVFDKRSSGLMLRPKPIFMISQHISELELFKKMQQHFGIGFITQNKSNQSVSFLVTSLFLYFIALVCLYYVSVIN
jgi:hypothetical protein